MWRFSRGAVAGFFGLVLAAPVWALQVPISGGGLATIETMQSVTQNSVLAGLRWTDSLGNVRRATASLRPVASRAAGLVTGILGRRLLVGAAVAAALYESVTALLPEDARVTEDGAVYRVGASLGGVPECESALLRVKNESDDTVSAYAYLPCYRVLVAPLRLVLRVPAADGWAPSEQWLNQYGTGSVETRALPFLRPGQTTVTETGFVEAIKPELSSMTSADAAADMPPGNDDAYTETQLAELLMTPDVIGELVQASALPADLWEPVDLETDEEEGTETDGGSDLVETTMDDVSRSVLDIRDWYDPGAWGWLPRTCHFPDIHLEWGDISIPLSDNEAWACPQLAAWGGTINDVLGIIIFLSVVLRVREGS